MRKIGKYKEEISSKIRMQDLIIFGIYSVIKNNEVCTLERLIAECFTHFPKIFSFKRYPQWPDAMKFDRPLRTLREKGLIVGGVGGKYSPGIISLTKFGEKKAEEVQALLTKKNIQLLQEVKEKSERSIGDKLINFLKENQKYQEYLNNPKSFSISEGEIRSLLRCTLETSFRILKQNLEYYKNTAKEYNEKQIFEFLSLCEKKIFKKLVKDA